MELEIVEDSEFDVGLWSDDEFETDEE